MDLPTKRVKPPNNNYSLQNIIQVLQSNTNIKYFAVSNVNSKQDLEPYVDIIPETITIVPKIESPTAIKNISDIVDVIPNTEKILMLDHDDLFSQIIKNKEPIDNFKNYIQKLKNFCNENGVTLLRTIGVIFSDEEKRISSYVN